RYDAIGAPVTTSTPADLRPCFYLKRRSGGLSLKKPARSQGGKARQDEVCHETFPPKFSASDSGRRRFLGCLARRESARLSVAAGAHYRRICPWPGDWNCSAANRSMALRAAWSANQQ